MFRIVLILALLAAPRRAVLPPQPPTLNDWLTTSAHSINDDLTAFGEIVGDAPVVGIGDVTHGTHECFTEKRRLFEYLVREKGFEVVAVEGPFLNFNAINQYVQGAPGDVNALLASPEHAYFFWEYKDFADFVNWMRDYNLTRAAGTPPLEIAGFDIYDTQPYISAVISYLEKVDPAAGVVAHTNYDPAAIVDELLLHEKAYVRASSRRAFDDALHLAQVVIAGDNLDPAAGRDTQMARDVLWLREHRGTNRKILLWAHDEHLGKTPALAQPEWPSMGMHLAEALGPDYVSIGFTSFGGSFSYLGLARKIETVTLRSPNSGAFEATLATAAIPQMIVNLRGLTPRELHLPHPLRVGTSNGNLTHDDSLSTKFDAVIQLEQTTPAK